MTVHRSIQFVLVCSLAVALAVPEAEARGRRDRKKKGPQGPYIAVIAVDLEGAGSSDLLPVVDGGVKDGLASADRNVFTFGEVRDKLSAPGVAGCTTTDCLNKAANELGVLDFLRAAITARGDVYEITLYLLSVNAPDGIVRRRVSSCDICTYDELQRKIADTARDLIQITPGDVPLSIEIVTEPAGAKLWLDGREVGAAPYTGRHFAGKYAVKAALEGDGTGPDGRVYEPAETEIEVLPGDDAQHRYKVELTAKQRDRGVPRPPPIPGPGTVDGPSRPYQTLKWIAAAAAAGAVAVGGVHLAFDGRCVDAPQAPALECPEVYQTKTFGVVELGVGGALGVATVWMFIRDGNDAERARQSRLETEVVPTAGGAFGSVRLRF